MTISVPNCNHEINVIKKFKMCHKNWKNWIKLLLRIEKDMNQFLDRYREFPADNVRLHYLFSFQKLLNCLKFFIIKVTLYKSQAAFKSINSSFNITYIHHANWIIPFSINEHWRIAHSYHFNSDFLKKFTIFYSLPKLRFSFSLSFYGLYSSNHCHFKTFICHLNLVIILISQIYLKYWNCYIAKWQM